MTIFVNASNLYSGGGLTVGLGVIHALLKKEDNTYIIAIPDTIAYTSFNNTDKVTFIRMSKPSFFGRLTREFRWAKVAEKHGCEAILSFTNYALPTSIPETLMIHWPYAVYPEKEIWEKMSFKSRLTRSLRKQKLMRFIKYADHIIVQTEVMKNRMQKYMQVQQPITIIPSAAGFIGDAHNQQAEDAITELQKDGNKVFLCINEYYEHKNLEILIPLAKKIKERNLPYRFIITLDYHNGSDVLEQVKVQQLANIIVNVGRVSRDCTRSLFKVSDALFFPSLIESFGIPLVEAMETGLPIYTSDRDFAHVVCKDYAIYFNPLDVENILSTFEQTKQTAPVEMLHWKEVTNRMLDVLTTH